MRLIGRGWVQGGVHWREKTKTLWGVHRTLKIKKIEMKLRKYLVWESDSTLIVWRWCWPRADGPLLCCRWGLLKILQRWEPWRKCSMSSETLVKGTIVFFSITKKKSSFEQSTIETFLTVISWFFNQGNYKNCQKTRRQFLVLERWQWGIPKKAQCSEH